jgi:hypothetical protein
VCFSPLLRYPHCFSAESGRQARPPLSPSDRTTSRNGAATVPAAGRDVAQRVTHTPNKDCDEARAEAARLHAHNYGCVTISVPTSITAQPNAASDVPLPKNNCTGDEDGNWYALRTMQCEIDPNVTYTYRNSDGEIIGRARFAAAQQIDLSTTSLKWTETDQLTMLESEGTIPDLAVSWTTTCSPTSTNAWTETPISLGQNLIKTYTLEDKNPTNTYDYLDASYELTIGSPGTIKLLPPITWGGVEVRCDQMLSITNSSGCVVPWFTSTLYLSRSLYGASTDMIEWAQGSLSGHWGARNSGQPLHRLQSNADKAKNRNAICGSTKFTKDPSIPEDTCDEFPFAGTYESAALNGIDNGNDCAQVTAVQAGSSGNLALDWPTIRVIGSFSGSEKCVRGHIPSDLNTDTGGAYGNFVVNMRLADEDPFWLNVAP